MMPDRALAAGANAAPGAEDPLALQTAETSGWAALARAHAEAGNAVTADDLERAKDA